MKIEELKALGVNTDEGLARCMNNEAFYFRLIGMALQESAFEKLEKAVGAGDLEAAFEAAHSLKGVCGNLSLTPLYETISEITELLRAKTQTDYAPLLQRAARQRAALQEIAAE